MNAPVADQRAGGTPAAPALLEVRDLDVFLGDSHVLQGVSFDVVRNKVTALLGRNGVGKTTTLRGILGLVRRDGVVRLGGVELTTEPTHRIVRRGIGYVPEDREVFAGLTVSENLRLAEQDSPRYELVYELFPRLAERSRQLAGTLSGGEQQMLALGRAFLNDNQLMLIDEPTKGLAPNLVVEVADALDRLTAMTTSLVVEQNLQVVQRLAEHAVVIDHGVVVHQGSVADLLADPNLTRELLGVASGGARGDTA